MLMEGLVISVFFFRDGSRIGVANLKQADKKHSDKITAADAVEVYLKANV